TKSRVSTWTLCPASRCSLRPTSMNRVVAGPVSPSQSNPPTSKNCRTRRWVWSAQRCAQSPATVILGMSLMTALPIVAPCAIALTPPRFGSFIATTWRPRAMGLTLIRWRIHDERRTRHIRRRLLLGHARPYPTARRRNLDEGGLYGWGRAECYLPQPRNSRRSYRDCFRSCKDQLPQAARVLFPDP